MVFTDAAFDLKNGKSSYSFFMMNYKSPLVAGTHCGPRRCSSKEAKARAILFALSETSRLGFFEIEIFSDAKQVIYCIGGN